MDELSTPIPLQRSFYNRSTLDVAHDMIGRLLVYRSGRRLSIGRVVETEAYDGPDDLASHGARRRTPRNEVMYGPPGYVYVYLIYGMYHCLNFVTGPEDYPAAVLVRGVEPLAGIGTACNGPGKLCRSLGIDLSRNLSDAVEGEIYLADGGAHDLRVETSGRIGVDYAGDWAHKPYRFFAVDNPHVSKSRVSSR